MTDTECQERSDRMAAVVRGEVAWSADDRAHIATCADCGPEWRLVQATAGLGQHVARLLNPDQVAARVVASLREPAPRAPRVLSLRRLRWLTLPLAAAAAIALVVWPGVRHGTGPAPAGTLIGAELLPEIGSLDADQLQSVLDLLPVPVTAAPDLRSFEDMTEDELSNLLGSLEG